MDDKKFNDLIFRHIGIFNLHSPVRQITPAYYRHKQISTNQMLIIGENKDYVLGKMKEKVGNLSLTSNHAYIAVSKHAFNQMYKLDLGYIFTKL